jgi:hypothetical protein
VLTVKYLKTEEVLADMDSGEDTRESDILLENHVDDLRQKLIQLPAGSDAQDRAVLLLELGRSLVRLNQMQDAWDAGKEAFETYIQREAWEGAIQALEIMFLSDQPDSLPALGQAIWLAVTYPVDPELTVAMLQHVVDETPPDSDGAAVAAAAAHYVADLRMPEGKERENLIFYTNQMLVTVARRHSDVQDQESFSRWFKRLELDDPAKFLVRLRNVVDVLVQQNWWFDRDALKAKLPVH